LEKAQDGQKDALGSDDLVAERQPLWPTTSPRST
jgi:hypothetical protein